MESTGSGPDPARIQSLSLFSSFTFEECVDLATFSEEREFEPSQHVMHQGDGGYTFFVIESGTAEVFVDGSLVRTLGPGDFIGERAILEGGFRTASVVASTPLEVLAMFGLEFRQLETDHPELAERIRHVTNERLG